MKVILLQDVPKIGRKFDIKDVSDGYAMNALLPKGLAVKATPQKIAELEKRSAEHEKEREAQNKETVSCIQRLDGDVVVITAKANEQGGLFKALTETDIVSVVQAEKNIALPSDVIDLPDHLKHIGEHEVTLQFEQAKGVLKVDIQAE